MNVTRNGKISRLPKTIRHEIGWRLENNQPALDIACWLNSHPECQAVLAEHFKGQPINQQNLTAWRQGGHQEWLANEEAIERLRHQQELAADLDPVTDGT